MRAEREAQQALQALAEEEGAHALLRVSSRSHGVVRGGGAGSRVKGDPEGLPQVAIPREQYNMIWRNVQGGVPVELELLVDSRFLDEDLQFVDPFDEIHRVPFASVDFRCVR